MAEEGGKKGLDWKHPGGKEALIAGGVALSLALLYFWYKNRQSQQAATTAQNNNANSPTALLLSWIHDHQSSSTGPDKDNTGPSKVVTVPNVVGKTDTQADAAIVAVGLRVHDVNEKPGGSGGGTKVLSQDPPGGTKVAPGSTVTVTLGAPTRKKVSTKGDHGDA